MKLSQTKRLILLIAIIVVVGAGLICFNLAQSRQNQQLQANYVQFDACSEDLNMLVDFLLAVYPDEESRPAYLVVAAGKGLLEPDFGPLNLPDAVTVHVQNIASRGFVSEQSQWCLITFDGNRIQFETTAGVYALVYSPDGAPTYLHQSSEDFPVLVEEIADHWYHVTRNG